MEYLDASEVWEVLVNTSNLIHQTLDLPSVCLGVKFKSYFSNSYFNFYVIVHVIKKII